MATEVTVAVWCDRDLDSGEHVPGEHVVIALDGKPPRELDLCKQCQSDLLDSVREALELWGHKVDGTKPTKLAAPRKTATSSNGERKGKKPANGERLQVCLCGVDFASPSGLLNHGRRIHGLSGFAEIFGSTCPICDQEFSKGSRASGLGSHAAVVHGASSVPQLFTMAEAQGDPFGIVKARREAVEASTVEQGST